MFIRSFVNKGIVIVVLVTLTIILNQSKIEYDNEQLDYLKANVSYLDFDNQNTFELIKDDLLNNQAFLSSEIHGIKNNYEIKFNMLKFLNTNADVNFLLLEISFSSGYLLNEYLNTGDLTILDNVFSFYKGSTFWTKEEYQFFIDLYNYNNSLPSNKKITLIGVDVEVSKESSDHLLNYNNFNNINLINHLNENINFNVELNNLNENNLQIRENRMYLNYLNLTNIYKINKFYGQFGMIHCFKEIINDNFKSLAYMLNNDLKSNVKDKTIVIMSLYNNSKYINPINYQDIVYYQSNKLNNNYINNNIDYFNDNDYTMFKLNNNNSPYKNNLIWLFNDYNVFNDNTITIDYFDYLILVNKSNSSTPLDETNSYFDIIVKIMTLKFKKIQ